jgi:sulfatase maturation enzyme AslB (radical SAM superfamily)
MREVILAGGEPFLIKEHSAFIKACCESGEAGHIRLRYHTNGTIFTEELIPYWEQFESVQFFVSLDGIGAVANYVRYPTDWKQICENIRRFDALGQNTLTYFHLTTHALNVYRIPEVLTWADESSLLNRKLFTDLQDYVCISLVHEPSYQSIRVLPVAYKEMVTRRITEYMESRLRVQRTEKLRAILDFMNAGDASTKLPSLVEYTKLLDQTRGTDFSATFSELIPFWNGEL